MKKSQFFLKKTSNWFQDALQVLKSMTKFTEQKFSVMQLVLHSYQQSLLSYIHIYFFPSMVKLYVESQTSNIWTCQIYKNQMTLDLYKLLRPNKKHCLRF